MTNSLLTTHFRLLSVFGFLYIFWDRIPTTGRTSSTYDGEISHKLNIKTHTIELKILTNWEIIITF